MLIKAEQYIVFGLNIWQRVILIAISWLAIAGLYLWAVKV